MPFRVNERVTLLESKPGEPYILQIQRYGVVIEDRPSGYMIELPDFVKPNSFGPFADARLAHGWLKQNEIPR